MNSKERLILLAIDGAQGAHDIGRVFDADRKRQGKAPDSGHGPRFDQCTHPDCLLVNTAFASYHARKDANK